MAKYRNPVIPEETAKALLYRCLICDKSIEGFYSQHESGGTCSRACMKVQDEKPRYPGHTAEDFYQRFNI